MDYLFVGILGFIFGWGVVYFLFKSSQVSRIQFDELQQSLIKKEMEFISAEKKITELTNQITKLNSIESQLIKISAEKDLQNQQLIEQQEHNKNQQRDITVLNQKNQEYFAKISELTAQNKGLTASMEEQKNITQKLQQESKLHFENLANKILEEKSEKFTLANKENLDHILKPLNENLEAFKKRVDEVYQNEARERFSLNNTIKMMMEQSNKISQEANNLASALKGQTKIQGDWGEMILERILENSGLTNGREYFTQMNIKTEDGENQRPDFILQLPKNQKVIIDSKVSLNSYEKMVSAENTEEQKKFLDLHILAVKNHINTLANKQYHKLKDSLDFTIMFVPIESAFLVAMQHDTGLWNYAYNKQVIVLSPTNLIAYLKLISDVWHREYQNQNAEEIARQAGDLYDQFYRFTDDLLCVGKKLESVKTDYDSAMKRLSTGRGNLVKRVENLKKLGVKANKDLPQNLVERANEE